jgi:hypothetical protein
MLEHLLDAQVSFHESGNKFYIKAEAVKRMFDLIGPSPVRCYEYKWKGGEHVMTAREAEEWYLPNTSGAPSSTASPTAGTDQPSSSAATSTPGGQVAPDTAAAPRPRPKVTSGRTERIETPRGRIYVVVNEDEMGVCEVFVHSFDVEAEAIGRLTSLALRAGVDPREVIEQLWRVQSKEVALDRSSDGTVVRVTTIAQAVALGLGRALYGETFRPDKAFPRADILPEPVRPTRQERLSFERMPTPVGERAPAQSEESGEGNGEAGAPGGNGDFNVRLARDFPLEFAGICPDCGATLIHENGCATCRSCGYAKC